MRRGTAGSGDYTVAGLSGGALAFDEDDESATFTISARTDNNDDDGETVNLSFGTLPEGVAAGTPSTATVTIAEPAVASFDASSYAVFEGAELTVTVRLDRPASQNLEIPINVRRGTAESGDYTVVGLSRGELDFDEDDRMATCPSTRTKIRRPSRSGPEPTPTTTAARR